MTLQGQAGTGSFLVGRGHGDFALLAVRALGLDMLLAAAVSFTLRVSVTHPATHGTTMHLDFANQFSICLGHASMRST